MTLIEDTLRAIEPPDEEAGRIARLRWDSLTKPRGSLGLLEEIVCRYAAVRHDRSGYNCACELAVFVADHGITEVGVSAYPSSVTTEMLRNIAAGGAAISVLARHFGFPIRVFDVGVAADTRGENLTGIIYQRLGAGTGNFLRGSAMTRDQARQSVETGINIAREAASRGATMIGIGEMGIGNSTSAAALLSALTGIAPERIAGRGAGLDDAGLRRKLAAIEDALRLHRADLEDPEALLAALGGFEIGAMAGVCIGAAASRLPVMVDGFIATSAALLARRFKSEILSYLFFSHRSAEGGHALVLEQMKVRAILDLDLRLGEGTGAAMAMSLIQAALSLIRGMATFEGAGVSEKIQSG